MLSKVLGNIVVHAVRHLESTGAADTCVPHEMMDMVQSSSMQQAQAWLQNASMAARPSDNCATTSYLQSQQLRFDSARLRRAWLQRRRRLVWRAGWLCPAGRCA